MGFVYKITNTVNGKAYIGISIHEPEKRRIRASRYAVDRKKKIAFHQIFKRPQTHDLEMGAEMAAIRLGFG